MQYLNRPVVVCYEVNPFVSNYLKLSNFLYMVYVKIGEVKLE